MTYENWLLYKQGKYEPDKNEGVVITGSPFKLDTSNNMYRIGVFEGDDYLPHFHILYEDTGIDYCSLRLDIPEYMEDSPNILTNDQLDILQYKLCTADTLYPFDEPLWSLLVIHYSANNNDNKIPLNCNNIIDYTVLKTKEGL